MCFFYKFFLLILALFRKFEGKRAKRLKKQTTNIFIRCLRSKLCNHQRGRRLIKILPLMGNGYALESLQSEFCCTLYGNERQWQLFFVVNENASLQLCVPICMDWHTDHSVINMALNFYYMYIQYVLKCKQPTGTTH